MFNKIESVINDFIECCTSNLGIENLYWFYDNKTFKYSFSNVKERNIYSHTKAFVSLLIGISLDKNEISLNDSLDKFFNKEIEESKNLNLKKIKVEHLLNMSSGFSKPLLMVSDRKEGIGYPDYLKYMFNQEVIDEPGCNFVYSSADTYLLGRILEKITNKNLNELAYERIFKKLNIGHPIWECDFEGHPFGGSGLILSIEDMNKLGQLVLNDGKYNDEQIVSKNYIDQLYNSKFRLNSKVVEGYKNQFWIVKENEIIKAEGMYHQISFIFKNIGLVFSVQCNEDCDFKLIEDLLFSKLIEKLS